MWTLSIPIIFASGNTFRPASLRTGEYSFELREVRAYIKGAVPQPETKILEISGFASTEDARTAYPRMRESLLAAAVQHDAAMRIPEMHAIRVAKPSTIDPEAARENLGKTFNIEITRPVHGLESWDGTALIFETGQYYASIAVPVPNSWTVNDGGILLSSLSRDISVARRQFLHDNSTAIETFISSAFEPTIKIKFLTLTTCLELLAQRCKKRRPEPVLNLLRTFVEQTEAALVAHAEDAKLSGSLRSLKSALQLLVNESIGSAIRTLIRGETADGQTDAQVRSEKAASLYGKRSAASHAGSDIDRDDTLELRRLVYQVLRVELFNIQK